MDDKTLGRRAEAFLDGHDPADRIAFRGAQFDAGLAWVHHPEGRGGLGLARSQQSVVTQAFTARGIPPMEMAANPIGLGMAAPTLMAWAPPGLLDTWLRPIFTAEHIWCQMFSEPSAGSDVAGISTRAVRDGEDFVVNGQKVWTTLAHKARYGLLLARTDPDVPKHRGLSYFAVDMHSPGIDVRPLFQLTGDAEFNEIFLTDVRVPAAQLLGAEGDGWRVATTTLMNERVSLGAAAGQAKRTLAMELLDEWQRVRESWPPAEYQSMRWQVVEHWVEAEVQRLLTARATAMARAGQPGPEGSIAKLASTELGQRLASLLLDLQGAAAMLHKDGYPMARSEHDMTMTSPSKRYLRSRAFTIEGGTSEVMRNILGERMLGLPPDIRLDKDVPWSEIPK
jgi:alkylation response protein AidB-like acyl-CoA dehydrogenase